MPNTNISMCVTSCNRHDLLKQTLESFYAVVDQEPQELLIYEDSDAPMPEFLKEFIWKQRGLRWVAGGERKGQAFACTLLLKAAKHDFIFWCEDDWYWQFNTSSFMRESKEILNAHPHIIQVSLRGDTGWHPLIAGCSVCGKTTAECLYNIGKCAGDGKLQIPEPYWRGVWGGWAWNPGLRRRKDCVDVVLPLIARQIGKSGLVHEENVSKTLLDQGYRMADLGRPVITHIGGNRSRAIESLPPLPKILIAVPTCFEFDYESHNAGPDCAKEGFHQNGPNEQTEAVRDTWGKDVLEFPSVTLKFFYGKPKDGYPRLPKSDEVFLDCGDGYDSLIQKTVGICTYAAQEGYKVVYKADTDTLVDVTQLLIEIMDNRFDYAGYLHGGVCSGGPGYLLSQRACQIISTQGRSPRHAFAEDVHVSRVLGEAGIKPLMLPAHRPGFSDHFFFKGGFDPLKLRDIVSAHAVFPEDLRKWYEWKKKQEKTFATQFT